MRKTTIKNAHKVNSTIDLTVKPPELLKDNLVDGASMGEIVWCGGRGKICAGKDIDGIYGFSATMFTPEDQWSHWALNLESRKPWSPDLRRWRSTSRLLHANCIPTSCR